MTIRSSLKLAVVGIPGAWSTLELANALAERNQGQCLVVDLARVAVDFARGTFVFEGHDLAGFDAVVVKKIAPSYDPTTLDRAYLLAWLASRGVRVFSRPDSILALLDRLSCTVRLQIAGIPMPETLVTEELGAARAFVERCGRVIAKPLFTSKARGMLELTAGPNLEPTLAEFARTNPVMYLQRRLEIPGRDLGVTFLGGAYFGSYARVKSGDSWSTSTSRGGRYAPVEPSPEILELAARAQAPFELDFTCVDVVETERGPLVFEVSAFGGFRGLKEACGLDVAGAYADHVLAGVRR